MVDGQQLDGGHGELAQVLDRRVGGERGVGAAQILIDLWVTHREALDVSLVDDRLAPLRARRPVVLPVESLVDDYALRDRLGVVLVVGF